MIGIPIALLAANGVEWYLHKYALHGIPQEGGGRKSISPPFMKRHWAHHKQVRLSKYRDDYLYGTDNEDADCRKTCTHSNLCSNKLSNAHCALFYLDHLLLRMELLECT
jgi:hypothetical protein